MTSTTKPAPSKGIWTTALIAGLIGAGASIYSIKHHMELKLHGHTEAACNINSQISCDAVAASKYSELLGAPLGVWGLGYFFAMSILALTVLAGHKSAKEHAPSWILLSLVGVVSSIGLGFISLGILKTVCIVCILVYAASLLQAVVAWLAWRASFAAQDSSPIRISTELAVKESTLDFSIKNLGSGILTAAIAAALAFFAFNFIKPTAQLPSELQDLPGKHDGPVVPPTLAPTKQDIPINKSAYSGLGEDYRKGPDDAKIVIVEFADYMCPACAQTAPVIEELHRQLGQRSLIVFKNYPLSNVCNSSVQGNMHAYSCEIAQLARCAGRYGKFWDYHLKAFEEQSLASSEKAKEWGKKVGLTDAQMNECLTSPDIMAKIKDDVEVGNKAGVNATPTIFINGRKYLGERTAPLIRAAAESL
jgi:protein-disulfide isomerase/uncharacterized membrane protein